MEIRENSVEEINNKLSSIAGEMIKIEYLENCLKKNLPLEVRKFVHIKISELYDKKLMFGVAAKNIENASEIATKFREKRELCMKQVELLIKNNSYEEAEKAMQKAIACSNTEGEKHELKAKLKNFYLSRALSLEKAQKRNNAMKTYEKILSLEPRNPEILKKLIPLYKQLGKIKEQIAMENLMRDME